MFDNFSVHLPSNFVKLKKNLYFFFEKLKIISKIFRENFEDTLDKFPISSLQYSTYLVVSSAEIFLEILKKF